MFYKFGTIGLEYVEKKVEENKVGGLLLLLTLEFGFCCCGLGLLKKEASQYTINQKHGTDNKR